MTNISLDQGTGGAASQELLGELFLKYLSSPVLHSLEDSALLEEHSGRLAFSTDCFINEPFFFPGGNIGSLAVNGTINNLAMRGAVPLALSLGIIIEEGFPFKDLEKIIESVSIAATIAEVAVVTGDTKVVPRGNLKGICVNISGIGLVRQEVDISGANIQEGDAIIVSGNIGEHGLAVRSAMQKADFCASVVRPLHFMVQRILDSWPGALHALRDPTRGGLATSFVWLASASGVCMELDESTIPVSDTVRQMCKKHGLNPLYLSSEGRCILCCDPEFALDIIAEMRTMEAGRDACVVGYANASPMGRVRMHHRNGEISYLEALG